MTDDERKQHYFDLMRRYNSVACFLPTPENLDTDDTMQIAECELILSEMHKIQAVMDRLLNPPHRWHHHQPLSQTHAAQR